MMRIWHIKSFAPTMILVFMLLLSCNPPGLPPEGQTDDSGETSEPSNGAAKIIGLVVSSDYQPIPNASVGVNGLLTDRNGVVSGHVQASESGWIPVRAPGYVTNYTRPQEFSNDYQTFMVKLTAVMASGLCPSEKEALITIGEAASPWLQARVSPDSFVEDKVLLQLTEIDPRDMAVQEMETSPGEMGALYYCFAVNAVDFYGQHVEPQGPVEVLLYDEVNDINQVVLASFDPQSGVWESVERGCQRVDAEHIRCSLPHLSNHGFFAPGGDVGGIPGVGVGGGEQEEDQGDDSSQAYEEAKKRLGDIYKKADESGVPPDEGELEDVLKDLAEAAQKVAEEHPDEVGKTVLLDAAGAAQAAGSSETADSLLDAARDLVREIAEELLEDPDCGKLSELFNTAAQAQLLGGLDDLASQLLDKAKQREENCNIWKGTIHYTFFLSGSWPQNDRWTHYTGAQTWTEIHEVTIAINPESGAVDGDSIVQLSMAGAEYRLIMKSVCGEIINHNEIETDGGSGDAVLTFDGSYQDGQFSLGPMEVEQSEPVPLRFHSYVLLTYVPPHCTPVRNREISQQNLAPYTSQLVNGFFGKPEPPSLQTMLNSGTRSQVGETEVIRGTEEISYQIGVNVSPLIPVQNATVTWNFIRVNKAE